jgi:Sulfotransferase family
MQRASLCDAHHLGGQAMNTAQLLAVAERSTGLDDWGGDGYFAHEFRTLLDAMVHSLEHESALTEQGRRGAGLRLAAALEARLRFIDDRKRWPELERENIVRPIFITGLPRSGSTFLHTLMAQDPANRAPLTWEMILPSPPPTRADRASDPRIPRTEQLLQAMGLQTPEIVALHPFDAQLPEEDHLMTEIMLLGDNLPALWRMPSFNRQRAALDPAIRFRTHRMVLQNLQARFRAERVLLKNPGHIFQLEALLSEYPDAQIVQTHRDPAKVIPSVAALLVMMRRNSSHDVAPGEKIAAGNLRAFADGLAKAVQFRQSPGVNERFCDVHFRDLVADPVGAVERIYTHFGMHLADEARRAMQAWLANPASRTPKGRHTLAEYGLDEAAIDRAFSDYLEHYGVERERPRI